MPPPPAPGNPWPRSRAMILFGFLALFLALLIAFRAVLFPFLMAMFLAYLIEPVVAWGSREKRLGLRWSRGPIILVMYAVVITGVSLLVSCGVNRLSTSAKQAVADLKTELDKTAPAATFSLDAPAPTEVWIPAGTAVALRDAPARAFTTSYGTEIKEGLKEVRVLLDEVGAHERPPPDGQPLVLADPRAVPVPEGFALTVATDDPARGLEIVTEKRVIAPVAAQIERFTGEHAAPGLLRDFITERSRKYGADLGRQVVEWTQGAVVKLFGSIYLVVLILMLTAFIVIDRRRISAFFASLPPPHRRADFQKFIGYVDRGLAGVIRGQILICVVNGTLTWLGLWIFRVPYSSLLALVAGVFSLIPVFGTIASSVPIVLVALAAGGVHAGLMALLWICLIHLLEANVFNPLIMGTSAEMHPVIIIFALLAGEHTFGVWGALLAVPTASLIQSCFKYYRHEIEGIPPEEPHGHGRWVRSLLARLRGRRPPPPAEKGGAA